MSAGRVRRGSRHRHSTDETETPKVSKESATGGGDYGPVLDRSEDVEGYTVNFATFREDIDQRRC